ncbi:MAG: dimethyl sulfoxide reductase anchor subunit [Burkholderiales bacterium]|nr:dimethyl sulfoxide reductase anchor subunit [Burkholderiales bacterium]
MHPAFSVIFFTTLIGAAQGLYLALVTAEVLTLVGQVPAQQPRSFYALGAAISLVLLGGGLIASFFHLGRPERAWRSGAKWRTSWLSREVIVHPLFMGLVFVYGLAHFVGWADTPAHWVLVALGVIVCLTLFVCTGMIYACIRFLQEWATPLTLVNYFLLGTASGFTLASAFSAWAAPQLLGIYAPTAIILTLAALLTRTASLVRNAGLKPKSTIQTATGIKHPKVIQKSQGFMGGSFNTREFFHGKTPKFLRSVKWIFLVLTFLVPTVLVSVGLATASAALLGLAFAAQYAGLIAERWFFFAQANHPQNLYYQVIS